MSINFSEGFSRYPFSQNLSPNPQNHTLLYLPSQELLNTYFGNNFTSNIITPPLSDVVSNKQHQFSNSSNAAMISSHLNQMGKLLSNKPQLNQTLGISNNFLVNLSNILSSITLCNFSQTPPQTVHLKDIIKFQRVSKINPVPVKTRLTELSKEIRIDFFSYPNNLIHFQNIIDYLANSDIRGQEFFKLLNKAFTKETTPEILSELKQAYNFLTKKSEQNNYKHINLVEKFNEFYEEEQKNMSNLQRLDPEQITKVDEMAIEMLNALSH